MIQSERPSIPNDANPFGFEIRSPLTTSFSAKLLEMSEKVIARVENEHPFDEVNLYAPATCAQDFRVPYDGEAAHTGYLPVPDYGVVQKHYPSGARVVIYFKDASKAPTLEQVTLEVPTKQEEERRSEPSYGIVTGSERHWVVNGALPEGILDRLDSDRGLKRLRLPRTIKLGAAEELKGIKAPDEADANVVGAVTK